MATGLYIILAVTVAWLSGAGAWLASAGHSVRVQRTALGGAAVAAIALLAPSPWAFLALVGAAVALAQPQVVTHLAATGAIAVSFAGHLFLPGAAAASQRASRSYAVGTMDRAYLSSLKGDLRNLESSLDAAVVELGRYDAILLASRSQVYTSTGNHVVVAPTADRWHAWAHNSIADKSCDYGPDATPTCPMTLPIDSASVDPVRVFTPEWVRDSLPADHWTGRFRSLRPVEFRIDSILFREELQLTVTDSGWVAERDLAGWRCLTGTQKLAPAGVAPGGFVCHLLAVTWGGGADAHAH